jgi:sulfite reductase (ferredoxin)
MVPEEDVVATLRPLLTYYKQHRQENETLGDFCHRKGQEDLAAWAAQLNA